MKNTPEVVDLIKGFPYPDLTKIRGKPCRNKIILMEKELKANAASVETKLGGGGNGHLGLLMSEEKYATRSATPFVIPAHPGITPLFLSRTTQINARIISTQHENLVYIYELCRMLPMH